MSVPTAVMTPGSAGVPAHDTAGAARYLTFTLQRELYALDIQGITEIIEYRSLTVVPMMPVFIRGVLNLRGRVLPVVDLAARFGQSATTMARRTGIIVVQTVKDLDSSGSGSEPPSGIGIMVDAVNKVVHLSADDIEPPPVFGVGIKSDFISGMAKHEGSFIIILDVTKVLSLDDMVMLGRTAAVQDDLVEAASTTP